ncbi:MAG TPA: sulfur carrier protein ThiS [Ignavibacteria bacterium]|jgi:sulfur carrier protein
MKIKLNGELKILNGSNLLDEVITSYLNGKEARGIAVALNSTIVPKQKWNDTALNENDEVEIVHAVQGG